MRLTLIIHSLAAGGAERVMATLANAWAARGEKVTLLTMDNGSAPPFYALDARVNHRPLKLAQVSRGFLTGLKNNLRRVRVLRRAVSESRPDVVISFMMTTNIRTLVACRGLGVPVVISERISPAHAALGLVWERSRWVTYRWAAAIIAQTEREAASYPRALCSKIRVIPNPVALRPTEISRPAACGKVVLAVGRLEEQKGFDLLLRAFAALKNTHPDWMLTVWGEGSRRNALESLSRELGLSDRVFFPGRTPDLARELAAADLFVLPSRYEGFPNVLGEAMVCGLPVIAADCDYGPREVVRDGIDGVLVPPGDVQALAAAMNRLMADEAERRRLAGRAVEVAQRFCPDLVMCQWDKVLAAVTAQQGLRTVAHLSVSGCE